MFHIGISYLQVSNLLRNHFNIILVSWILSSYLGKLLIKAKLFNLF